MKLSKHTTKTETQKALHAKQQIKLIFQKFRKSNYYLHPRTHAKTHARAGAFILSKLRAFKKRILKHLINLVHK